MSPLLLPNYVFSGRPVPWSPFENGMAVVNSSKAGGHKAIETTLYMAPNTELRALHIATGLSLISSEGQGPVLECLASGLGSVFSAQPVLSFICCCGTKRSGLVGFVYSVSKPNLSHQVLGARALATNQTCGPWLWKWVWVRPSSSLPLIAFSLYLEIFQKTIWGVPVSYCCVENIMSP